MPAPGPVDRGERLDSPWPAPRVRAYVVLALAFGTSLMLTGWVGRKEQELLPGRLAAETLELRAPQDGRIEKWVAADGAVLVKGDAVLTWVDDAVQKELRDKREEVSRLESELRRRIARSEVDLAWRLKSVETEILANRLKTAELLQKEFDYKLELHAAKALLGLRGPVARRDSVTSPDDVFHTAAFTPTGDAPLNSNGGGDPSVMKTHESLRNAGEVVQVQLKLCEDRLNELQLLKRELPAKVRSAAGIDEAKSRLEAARAGLEALAKSADEQTGSQPLQTAAHGRLQRGDTAAGQSIRSGDVVARIVDRERIFVKAPVPADRLACFKPGKTVALNFPGDERRIGRVVELQNQNDGDSAVIIEPAGRLWPEIPLGSAASVVVPER